MKWSQSDRAGPFHIIHCHSGVALHHSGVALHHSRVLHFDALFQWCDKIRRNQHTNWSQHDYAGTFISYTVILELHFVTLKSASLLHFDASFQCCEEVRRNQHMDWSQDDYAGTSISYTAIVVLHLVTLGCFAASL